jgi:hypothetical protein
VRNFTGVNFDFIQHYRSTWNPVRRANELSDGAGRGIAITGHHELMIPLLCAAVNERLASEGLLREGINTERQETLDQS